MTTRLSRGIFFRSESTMSYVKYGRVHQFCRARVQPIKSFSHVRPIGPCSDWTSQLAIKCPSCSVGSCTPFSFVGENDACSFQRRSLFSSQPNLVVPTTCWQYGKDDDSNSKPLEEDEHVFQPYCTLSTAIVGVQYYMGSVGCGEQVQLIREPKNPYDRNAIQVRNISDMQVGYVPRLLAAKLAPLLDQGLVTLEGVTQEGNLSSYKSFLKMDIKVYGRNDSLSQLESSLPGTALPWEIPGQYGFRQRATESDVLDLPEHLNPPGIESGELKVNLLKHQRQALAWCIERENPVLPQSETDKPVQFWQLRKSDSKTYYYTLATTETVEAAPVLGRGAVCADDMGLGKTLTMIALILATKKDVSSEFSKSTLIVVPASILLKWQKQIDDHCVEGALSCCIYYGPGISLNAAELQRHDVVITTYSTVSGEDPNAFNLPGRNKMERSLFDVKWKRVIFDEGRQIPSARTKLTQAVNALQAERRWSLSETQIINSIKDLKICRPSDQEDVFRSLVLLPLARREPSGEEGIMSQICIRRTKGVKS